MSRTIGIIGCGNIGSALASCLASKSDYQLCLFDTDSKKLKDLIETCSVNSSRVVALESFNEVFRKSDIVVLAVKPPVVPSILSEVANDAAVAEDDSLPIIVSVAAGVGIREMQDALEESSGSKAKYSLVRAMPNLGMAYGVGMTGIYSQDSKAADEVYKLFSIVGEAVKLDSEELIAVVTGLAGSGPAFICEAIGAMRSTGIELGLSEEQAQLMASQTALGASYVLLKSDESPASLVKRVATPGGTTAQGLEVLKTAGFASSMSAAIKAAVKRAKESMS